MLALYGFGLSIGDAASKGISFAMALAGLLILFSTLTKGLTVIDGRLRRAHYRSALELAENHAGIGRWRFDYSSGLQSWSEGLSRTYCVATAPISDESVKQVLRQHSEDLEPFIFEMEVVKEDGALGLLRIFARNHFSATGNLLETYSIVVDVTRDYEELRNVAQARKAAVIEAERAKEMAMTDSLTGLANRRKAMAEIDKALMSARNGGQAVSLVIFDIDHFKNVNDTYGHQAGDAILKRVAGISKSQIRADDLVARIGGEEFLCIMRGPDLTSVEHAAERIRRNIEQDSAVGGIIGVTVSIGFASGEADEGCLSLFGRADAALYVAKCGGRNQVRKAA